MSAASLLPPVWLIHVAVAAVWFYEGLWCKLLNGDANQLRIAEHMPRSNSYIASNLLRVIGVIEVLIGFWVLTSVASIVCALVQTALLIALNACGLLWARQFIHDPAGMVVKNFAFLVLVWVSASFPAWT